MLSSPNGDSPANIEAAVGFERKWTLLFGQLSQVVARVSRKSGVRTRRHSRNAFKGSCDGALKDASNLDTISPSHTPPLYTITQSFLRLMIVSNTIDSFYSPTARSFTGCRSFLLTAAEPGRSPVCPEQLRVERVREERWRAEIS